ncbi:hypothetical protein [Methanolobus chelungpuianus]|uniref:Uncharacterized protein n=1 Tax=Methanolobus chelungpuianus TaxID=502115 RepID=A0AAE3HC88_9EURY|nr:hypothetical protein [Methanolobus chelungpuianus]MCQ6963148.1 hypothetical protein [Methanolobus chelungpuianus]
MKKIMSILLVFVMIGLVAVSGCTDTADEETVDETVVDEQPTEDESSEDVANETVDVNETSGEDVVIGENITADMNETVVEEDNTTAVETTE